MDAVKTCSRCRLEKTTDRFRAHYKSSDGLRPWCKDCQSSYAKKWHADNKESLKVKAREWRKNNRDRVRQRSQAWQTANRATTNQRIRERYRQNSTAAMGRVLKWKYGLTWEDYVALLMFQGGACAICRRRTSGHKRSNRLAVDHCHATGKVRALLCLQCNMALGALRDDPELLETAAVYLRKHREQAA